MVLSPNTRASSTSSLPPVAKYEILETLGSGTYGKVYKVKRLVDDKVREGEEVEYMHV